MKLYSLSHFKFGILIALTFILIPTGCNKTEETTENKAPTCKITNPDNGDKIEQGETITISVDADDADGNVTEVRFYINGSGVGFSSNFPYSYEWNTTAEETSSYTIKATAKDNDGSSTSDEISIDLFEGSSSGNEPVAAFTAGQTSVNTGSSVQFTDQSTNIPTSWSWYFGDESTSTLQNPSHTYNTAGTYTVTLTATNSYGYDIETKTNYITVTTSGVETGTVADYDGNTYNTIKIGTQWWMAENLKVTHYTNGTAILLVTDRIVWRSLGDNNTDDAYCYYNNDASGEADTYGALYTWAAAMGDNAVSSTANPSGVQGVCPDGWHLPSDAEWTDLTDYLTNNGFGYEGSGSDIAKSMASTSGWTTYSIAGTVGNDQASNNSSGFSALPGGSRSSNFGTLYNVGGSGNWWSSSEYCSSFAFNRYLYYGDASVYRFSSNKSNGFSVRCVRD